MVPIGISATAEAIATGNILPLLIESSAVPEKGGCGAQILR
jgi:hypothetical protein